MSKSNLKSSVEQALSAVASPEMVRDLAVDAAGAVSFTFVLARETPGALPRQARKAAEGVPGVTSVKVNVIEPASPAGAGSGRAAAAPRGPAAGVPPPPTPEELPALGKVLAISSG